MGVGAGTPERALSPPLPQTTLGTAVSSLTCSALHHPRELVSLSPEAKRKLQGPRGLESFQQPETQLDKRHCRPNGDSLLLFPSIILLKEGQASQGGAVLPLIGEMRPPVGCLSPCCMWGCRGWPGGLGRLSPATAGLSVKGLPVTKNFL